ATGCKIGWVSETSTLISARWSGPMVAGKGQGKGNLTLTIKDKDGKEYQGQGEAEMLAGLLNGKAVIKWSDGESYDGYYKAGQREGKGILKLADGSVYEGEWKAGKMEGTGVLKDAAGKIIHEGAWKDDKPVTHSAQPKTDNVLGIPWGASEGEAKRIMLQRPNTVYFSANSDANTRWHTYMGGFNDYGAKIQVHFYQGKMYGVGVFLPSSEDQLLDKFNSVKQGLTQRYGPPLMDKGKYLDSVAGWDLGGDYIVIIEIRKNTDTVFIEPFAVMISYQNQATQNEIDKGKTPTSGNDY
ncbi:MAG: hypothetical protein MUO24_08310, partial [Desulfobacterales bacterium]|nr:hypothetical protein [Desulfobacterales bacterium]